MSRQLTASNPLTDKQAAFVDAFVSNNGNKVEAAIAAGYSQSCARIQAYQLLHKPHVVQAIMDRCALELISNAPAAISRIHELLYAKSEYVALEAAKDILDRSGFKPVDKHDHRIAGDISVTIDLG
jgi:phage terminase small subunit